MRRQFRFRFEIPDVLPESLVYSVCFAHDCLTLKFYDTNSRKTFEKFLDAYFQEKQLSEKAKVCLLDPQGKEISSWDIHNLNVIGFEIDKLDYSSNEPVLFTVDIEFRLR